MKKVCAVCGDTFRVKPSRYDKAICCGKECSRELPMLKVIARLEAELGEPLGEYLKKEYEINNRSFRWLCEELKINNRTVPALLEKYGIEIRQGSDAVKTQWLNNDKRKEQARVTINKIVQQMPVKPRSISERELIERTKHTDFTFVDRLGPNSIKIKCKCCKKEYIKSTDYLLHNKKCFECLQTSIGEHTIKTLLESKGIEFKQQLKFEDCRNERPLPFDFGIFENNKLLFLIEFDGKQHFNPEFDFGGSGDFEKIRRNDTIKSVYCLKKKIPLLRINHRQNIQKVLENTFKIIS